MDKVYDLIIIGAGPAGITAAIYAARKRMDFLVLTDDVGGQTAWSGKIENYTGYQLVTGPELTAKFEEHIKNYGVDVRDNEPVTRLVKEDSITRVKTAKKEYLSRTVIIASGKKSRELGVPGEKEFKNMGLTYCATCDGPLFQGKDVAVIGGGNSALDAALQLTAIARSVHIVNNTEALSGDEIMREKVTSDKKVEVHNASEVTEIFGSKFVEGIVIKSKDGDKKLPVEGVFVEIGLTPNSSFAEGVAKNNIGEIIVNCATETNVPGVFAAGDVTTVIEKQIIIAAGEGSKAALQAFRYLATRREET